MKTKGKTPCPRHSHAAEILNDKLFIVGGTKASDLFERDYGYFDAYLLDLTTLTWI